MIHRARWSAGEEHIYSLIPNPAAPSHETPWIPGLRRVKMMRILVIKFLPLRLMGMKSLITVLALMLGSTVLLPEYVSAVDKVENPNAYVLGVSGVR